MPSNSIDRIRKISTLQDSLLDWYSEHGRSFPWRKKSCTNYELIISEVFLQRTKAETVAAFLPLFLNKYPSWKKLGDEGEIKLQESLKPIGLYMQRGSRLYRLAQEMKKRKGRFPKSRTELEEMPMMGQYIANAFELYILKKHKPLLDVNMVRVLERYFEPRKMADIRYDKELQKLAHKVIDHPLSKELNWAILDFAALVCKNSKPLCTDCGLNKNCNYISNT